MAGGREGTTHSGLNSDQRPVMEIDTELVERTARVTDMQELNAGTGCVGFILDYCAMPSEEG